MLKYIDLTGQRFGRLTVLTRAPNDLQGTAYWKCKCECGNTRTIRGYSLRSKITQSCGCLHDEIAKHNLTGNRKHGQSYSVEYLTWIRMKTRCYNSSAVQFVYYGARGITVCDKWLNSFETFLEDMGERPKNTSIDRINNDGNYESSNCRWATPKEQAGNRRPRQKCKANPT